jgi:hypothetical protein
MPTRTLTTEAKQFMQSPCRKRQRVDRFDCGLGCGDRDGSCYRGRSPRPGRVADDNMPCCRDQLSMCFVLHDPAGGPGWIVVYFAKTQLDPVEKSLYVNSCIENLDHLFEGESSLFTCNR